MVPAGNKAKRLSSVNHTTKTNHHYHHHTLSNILAKMLNFILNMHESWANVSIMCLIISYKRGKEVVLML